MSIRMLFTIAASLAWFTSVANERADHLVPEPGSFADYSYEYEASIRRNLFDKATGYPDFQIVVRPSFDFEWMLYGNSKSSTLTLTRANEKISRAQGRDVQLTTVSTSLAAAHLQRLRALIVAHLATVRHEASAIDDVEAGEQQTTKVVIRTDGTTYHFVARAISGTSKLSGQMYSKGSALSALETVVLAAADFVRSDATNADQSLLNLLRALEVAEQEMRDTKR